MKLISLLLACLVLLPDAAAQNTPDIFPNPTIAAYGLRGPVKFFREERAEASGKPYPLMQCTFDEKGNALEFVYFDFYHQTDKVESHRVFHYNANGISVGEDAYSQIYGLENPQRVIYTLDAHGWRIEQRVIQPDGKPGPRFTYKYDGLGNLVEKITYSWPEQEHPEGVIRRTYDARGNMTHEEYINSRDTTAGWISDREYNAAGQLVRASSVQTGAHAVYDAIWVYAYDDQNRKASVTITTPNRGSGVVCVHCPEPGRTTYAYVSRDRATEEITYDTAGKVTKVFRSAYDEFGNPTQLDVVSMDGSGRDIGTIVVDGKPFTVRWSNGLRHITYSYDSHGNWTQAEETTVPSFNVNGPRTLSLTNFRTIKYY
jgi:hypothetical protein